MERVIAPIDADLWTQVSAEAKHLRRMRGDPVPSSTLMAPVVQRFVTALKRYGEAEGIEAVSFRHRERNPMREYLRTSAGGEGVLYVGTA